MIFVVCGGRDFSQDGKLFTALDQLHAQYACSLVMTGGASGADTAADRWAQHRGIDRLIVPANWEGDGKAAGPYRNARMLRLARGLVEAGYYEMRVIAFPGGNGTADMCRKARAAGVQVIEPMGESVNVK
jgi:predicted Rossmann-fold nucleotide-binding protein